MQESNPDRLQLTDKMKKEGARVLRQEVLRLRMEANIGKAPPLTDEELFVRIFYFNGLTYVLLCIHPRRASTVIEPGLHR